MQIRLYSNSGKWAAEAPDILDVPETPGWNDRPAYLAAIRSLPGRGRAAPWAV